MYCARRTNSLQMAVFIVENLVRTWIGLLLFGQQHGEFALSDRAIGTVNFFDKVSDLFPVFDHFVGCVVVSPGGVSKKRSNFITRFHHVLKHVTIFRICAGVKGQNSRLRRSSLLAKVIAGIKSG